MSTCIRDEHMLQNMTYCDVTSSIECTVYRRWSVQITRAGRI